MGIFNKEIFSELEDGIKNFSNGIKENINSSSDKKEDILKCPSCGARLKSKNNFCEYCGAELQNKNISNNNAPLPNGETKLYPVLVEYEKDAEGGFYAYDCQTDTGTDCYNSVAKALKEIKDSLQEILDDGYDLKFWTEDDLSKKLYAKSRLKKGAKIKFIELEYIDPTQDPDW